MPLHASSIHYLMHAEISSMFKTMSAKESNVLYLESISVLIRIFASHYIYHGQNLFLPNFTDDGGRMYILDSFQTDKIPLTDQIRNGIYCLISNSQLTEIPSVFLQFSDLIKTQISICAHYLNLLPTAVECKPNICYISKINCISFYIKQDYSSFGDYERFIETLEFIDKCISLLHYDTQRLSDCFINEIFTSLLTERLLAKDDLTINYLSIYHTYSRNHPFKAIAPLHFQSILHGKRRTIQFCPFKIIYSHKQYNL